MQFPKKQLFSSKKSIEGRQVFLDVYVKIIAKISPLPVEVKRFLGLADQDLTGTFADTSTVTKVSFLKVN